MRLMHACASVWGEDKALSLSLNASDTRDTRLDDVRRDKSQTTIIMSSTIVNI
jgi:hypothetical protein